jgi:hypothetical protein
VALVQDGDKPPRRRIWIKAFQSHRNLLPFCALLLPLPRNLNFTAHCTGPSVTKN